jgi:hypothetical protein
MIIESTLFRMFPVEHTSTKLISPLTIRLFTAYIWIPHVATTLIAQDFNESMEDARKRMIESGAFGEAIHPADDEEDLELDIILRENVRSVKASSLIVQRKKVWHTRLAFCFVVTLFF